MVVSEMSKEQLKSIELREKFNTEIENVYGIVIIPEDYKHGDSDAYCMSFIAVDKQSNPICKFGGCCDMINLANSKDTSISVLDSSGYLFLYSMVGFEIGSDLSTMMIKIK